jgi:branched-chain amino acid transport system ATP-binding protein
MLELKDIKAGYNKKPVLNGISMTVDKGEIVALIGPNGAGKSTVLKTIIGVLKTRQGAIFFNGEQLSSNSPSKIIGKGIVYVPQGNAVFNDLTVLENLQMGAFLLTGKTLIKQRIQEVFDLFPEIAQRKNMDAGNLSGGEKQMLALGRALMLKPDVLLLDESSLGLSPKAVKKAFDFIKDIAKSFNTAVLMVEQNIQEALRISDRVYVMVLGKVVTHDTPTNLTRERIKALFLGEGGINASWNV